MTRIKIELERALSKLGGQHGYANKIPRSKNNVQVSSNRSNFVLDKRAAMADCAFKESLALFGVRMFALKRLHSLCGY